MTLVLGKGGMGRWEGDGEGDGMGRRQLDGNCDGEEVFEILLYTPPPFSVCEVVCILGEQVIILHTPPPLPVWRLHLAKVTFSYILGFCDQEELPEQLDISVLLYSSLTHASPIPMMVALVLWDLLCVSLTMRPWPTFSRRLALWSGTPPLSSSTRLLVHLWT